MNNMLYIVQAPLIMMAWESINNKEDAVDIENCKEGWDELWFEKPLSPEKLKIIARELGHEVGRNGVPAAQAFIKQLRSDMEGAVTGEASVSELVRGFRLGLLEYLNAYDAGRRAFDSEVEAKDTAKRERWGRILKEFETGPLCARKLARILHQKISKVSRALAWMCAEGLLQVIPSSTPKEAKDVSLRLTFRGKRIAEQLKKELSQA